MASAVIAILLFLFLLGTYLPFTRSLTGRTLRLQAVSLSLAWLMLFGSMIAYMIFFVNRQAGVKAFIGNIQLPDSAVQAVEKMTGQTGVYRHIHYCKFFIFTISFFLAGGLLRVHPRRHAADAYHRYFYPLLSGTLRDSSMVLPAIYAHRHRHALCCSLEEDKDCRRSAC